MSNNKRRLLSTGFSLAASFGLAIAMGAGADEPRPGERATGRAAAAVEERYLLLTDGRLIPGVISHDETTYTVTQKLGVIRFSKKMVERSFDTVREAYEYRLARLPEDDPAERLLLARWCLNLRMPVEARAQLEKVLEISPDHGPAKAMLTKIAQSEASRAIHGESKVDAEVQQTAGEQVREDDPKALDSAVLRGARRGMGISGLPVIFDLPQPLAVRRAEEFKQFVHPVLQAYCAKCHNSDYDGPFQLVTAVNPKQRTRDALRYNLDATLRLIDPETPAKSELLSSTLRPHGVGGKKRPIFPGSNNRAYQILATWVNSLRPSPGSDSVARAGSRASAETDEAFGTGRNRDGVVPLDEVAHAMKTGDPRAISAIARPGAPQAGVRAYKYVEGQGMVADDPRQVDPQEFPLPPLMGGAPPSAPTGADPRIEARARALAARAAAAMAAAPATGRAGPATPPADPDAATPAAPVPAKPRSAAPKTDPSKRKPVKIDPAILERLLQKNADRPVEP